MGYNTTVVVMNDALGDIARDPDFGKNLASAISQKIVYNSPIDVKAGCHVNAATVIETHHADVQTIVVIGGNYGKEIGFISGWTPATKEDVFKELARSLGYVVYKKNRK